MNHFHRTSMTILLLAGAFYFTQPPMARADGKKLNGMAAIVNGEVITLAEVEGSVYNQVRIWVLEQDQSTLTQAKVEAKMEEFRKQGLQDLIDRKLILAKAKELGMSIRESHLDQMQASFINERFKGNDKKFYEELQKAGLTIKTWRDNQREQIMIQALRNQNVPKDIIVTPNDISDIYKRRKREFETDPKIKLRMISIAKVPTDGSGNPESQKKLITELRQQIIKGADFATMATTHSNDSFAAAGGDVGTIDRNVLNPTLTSIAFSLEPRKVSEIIDDGPFYRLMFVDARIGGNAPPPEKIRDELEKLVIQEQKKGAYERWVETLRHSANIRLFQ